VSTMFQSGNDGQRDTLIVTHPPHFPTMHTRETVTCLVAFGLDEYQIAAVLKCTPDEVKRHYAEELEHGLARVNARVMSAVLHAALYENSAPDRKLWLVNRANWKGGDGNKTNILNAPGMNGEDGETLTVVQRREVITKLLVRATQHKRQQERVIDAEVVPVAKSTNGNGTNGHGTNGANGHGGTNGTKHR
jgi:hypothetical protein